VYSTQGIVTGTNIPGARTWADSWIDGSGNLWLFGGAGWDSIGANGYLNDLWKFDGTNWSWVSGSNLVNQIGVYGTQSVPAGTNIPGAREYAVSWIDGRGNFWLFGGLGYDSAGTFGSLNDLWRYHP
jgi:hypothetical protein